MPILATPNIQFQKYWYSKIFSAIFIKVFYIIFYVKRKKYETQKPSKNWQGNTVEWQYHNI